jgi:hypothetical protein
LALASDDAGIKISSLSTSLALFVLKNRRKKQASDAMLMKPSQIMLDSGVQYLLE